MAKSKKKKSNEDIMSVGHNDDVPYFEYNEEEDFLYPEYDEDDDTDSLFDDPYSSFDEEDRDGEELFDEYMDDLEDDCD